MSQGVLKKQPRLVLYLHVISVEVMIANRRSAGRTGLSLHRGVKAVVVRVVIVVEVVMRVTVNVIKMNAVKIVHLLRKTMMVENTALNVV